MKVKSTWFIGRLLRVANSNEFQTSQPLSQTGTVIALTPNSMTTRSAVGFPQTYLVTPVATAVADRAVTELNGPPMDSVGVQPVSSLTTEGN